MCEGAVPLLAVLLPLACLLLFLSGHSSSSSSLPGHVILPSLDTIVESFNVNGEDQRFLTIGIHGPDTITEEPDIRRSASSEMTTAGCRHRRDLSDESHRRTSTPDRTLKQHQRRNSSVVPGSISSSFSMGSFNDFRRRIGLGGKDTAGEGIVDGGRRMAAFSNGKTGAL